MADDLGILICETVAPELEAVVEREGWDHVEIQALAGGCVQRGRHRGPPASLVAGMRLPSDRDLHHIRCGCFPDLGLPLTVHDHIAGRRLESCFQLFLPGGEVDQYLAAGAYLATSGWLAAWEEHLAREGLTAATARELFQEIAKNVVLVDTGIRSDAEEHCRAFSRCLGLPWTVVHAGLDLTTLFLRDVVHQAHVAGQAATIRELKGRIRDERASTNLILDLQRELSSLRDEGEVLARIHGLCEALYAPGQLVVASWQRHEIHGYHPRAATGEQLALLGDFLGASTRADYRLLPGTDGFMLRFRRGEAVNGGVLMGQLAFPEYRDQYLNQALALVPVCELVISRVRALQGILPVCAHCHQIRDGRGRWCRFEEYITSHSDALFSHSVCPGCLREHYPEAAPDILDEEGGP